MCKLESPCIQTILRKIDKQHIVDLWVLLKENSVQTEVDKYKNMILDQTSRLLKSG